MIQENKDWLKDYYSNLKYINEKAYIISTMASSFYKIGMDSTGDRLGSIAQDLLVIEESLRDIISEKIGKDFNQSIENSNNILKTALAVLEKKVK